MSETLKRFDKVQYIDGNAHNALSTFSAALSGCVLPKLTGYKDLVILCIGTDRATGDCLGPIIGHKLAGFRMILGDIKVYGDLENPVHAKNLSATIDAIYSENDRPFIIAIDACLGRLDHVGFLTVGEGPVKPGAGVNKELPTVGDAFITGIVNFSGMMDAFVIQSTRLSVVMKMADIITYGLVDVFRKPFVLL